MRLSIGLASLLAGWITLAAAALAQTAPPAGAAPTPASPPASAPVTAGEPTTIQGVTVTARPLLKDLPSAVSNFVRSHGAPSRRIEQIARWGHLDPLCVVTIGLDPAFNDFVSRRVEAVAASVGAPVAQPKPGRPCANVEIMFARYPQALALVAFKRNDLLMGYHYPHDVPGLRKFEPPIKAWYATGTRNRNGHRVLDTIWTTLGSTNAVDSRLRSSFSSEFVNIMVIADINLVAGQEIGPISDYMAMLVLSQPRSLAACDALPSILDLFSANCSDQDKPKALTPADLAYLTALYTVSSEQYLYPQRDDISDVMRRKLTAAP